MIIPDNVYFVAVQRNVQIRESLDNTYVDDKMNENEAAEIISTMMITGIL